MSETPPEPPGPISPWLEHLTGIVALLAGALSMALAVLVTSSVGGRWLFDRPIEGDFEIVKMATAVAIFAFLPYTQARRGNIIVDTFTGWLPRRFNRWIDAFWDLVLAAFMAVCTWGLVVGTTEAIRSHETTMQLQVLVWPSIAACALLSALVVLTSAVTAFKLIRGRS